MFLKSGEKTPVQTVNELRHDLLLNFSEDVLFEEVDTHFPHVYIELPYPILKPLKTSEDSVKRLLKEKAEYDKLLEIKRKRYAYDKKKIEKEKIGTNEYMYLPKHLLEFYKKKDPDICFNCDYNYYFTGGVLEHIELNSDNFLIRPDVDNYLLLTNLNEKDADIKLNYATTTTIYSLNSTKTADGLRLVLREKHKINVLSLTDVQNIDFKWSDQYELPVLDSKLNENDPVHLGVILSDRQFFIKNIETNKAIYKFRNKVATNSDNFQQFSFLNDNLILLMDRFNLKILDHRTKNVEKCFNPQLIDCNSLCTFTVMDNDLFLGSRHYLMKTDLRYLDHVSNLSHSLNAPPCYMDLCNKHSETYLLLASQISDSKVMFKGRSSYSLPHRVPGICETLKECKLAEPSLILEDHLDERLNYSTTGLKVINKDNIFVYTVNCLGEIFKQEIADKPTDAQKPIQKLFNWVNDLIKSPPLLTLTHVEEMSRARFALNTAPIERNLVKYTKKSKTDVFLQEFGYRFSKKNVTGTLANDFLTAWNDSDEEVEDLPEVPAIDKVNTWIQTHDFADDRGSEH